VKEGVFRDEKQVDHGVLLLMGKEKGRGWGRHPSPIYEKIDPLLGRTLGESKLNQNEQKVEGGGRKFWTGQTEGLTGKGKWKPTFLPATAEGNLPFPKKVGNGAYRFSLNGGWKGGN